VPASVNRTSISGRTPLDLARSVECIALLLDAGARLGPSSPGCESLRSAVAAGSEALVVRLLAMGADVNSADDGREAAGGRVRPWPVRWACKVSCAHSSNAVMSGGGTHRHPWGVASAVTEALPVAPEPAILNPGSPMRGLVRGSNAMFWSLACPGLSCVSRAPWPLACFSSPLLLQPLMPSLPSSPSEWFHSFSLGG